MKRGLLTLLLLIQTPLAWGDVLSMESYLDMVINKNESYQGADAQAKGSQGLEREADLLFMPQFFAEAKTGYDQKLQRPSFFVYEGTDTNTYSLGFSQQSRTGLTAKLSYLLVETQINGAESVLGPNTRFTDGAAQLELSMPLWGNGFGRGARANEEVTRQQATANKFNAVAQSLSVLVNAETTYWRLAAAVEQLKIEEQTLKAAKSILSYVTEKRKKDLGETADVLQSNALVEAYSLQVQQAQTEVRAAQREFNLHLNRDALTPVPALESLNFLALEAVTVPQQRPGDHPDVRAGEAQAKMAKATNEIAAERNKPTLDVYGSYTSYGQRTKIQETIEESYRLNRDGAFVGVRLAVPLGFSALSDAKAGAYQAQRAAEKNLSYMKYAQEQQWTDLVQKFNDAKQTLTLATSMEKAQKAKLENERKLLRQGRTTTQQVLFFEQDYNKAQASRVQAASRILNLKSQTKLYQANLEQGGK